MGFSDFIRIKIYKSRAKKFLTAPFFESFFQLAPKKKDSKNSAAKKLSGPSCFVTALTKILRIKPLKQVIQWFRIHDLLLIWSFSPITSFSELLHSISYYFLFLFFQKPWGPITRPRQTIIVIVTADQPQVKGLYQVLETLK